MISEKDIQDWVHTDTNLAKDSSFSKSEDGNLYNSTKLYNTAVGWIEAIQKVVDNLSKVKPYNLQGKC